jgi:hypothetical protein
MDFALIVLRSLSALDPARGRLRPRPSSRGEWHTAPIHVRRWLQTRGGPSRFASGGESTFGFPSRPIARSRRAGVECSGAVRTRSPHRAVNVQIPAGRSRTNYTQPSQDEPDATVPHTMRSNQPQARTFSFNARRCELGRSLKHPTRPRASGQNKAARAKALL